MGVDQFRAVVNGVDMAWLEAGEGRPILMLHGLGGDGASTFEPVIDHLDGFSCWAPWARGHGESGWADCYLIEDYAADAGAFLDDVIGGPATIVGFSLGSMTAAYLGVHRPDLVTALFLEDSPLLVLHDPARHEHETYRGLFAAIETARRSMIDDAHDIGWFQDQVARMTLTSPGVDATFGDVLPRAAIEWMASLMVDNDPEIYVPPQTLPTAELIAALPPDDLASITCPVHLIAGQWEHGGSLPTNDLERWQQLIPHATTSTVPDVGHAIRFAPNGLPRYLHDLDTFLAHTN